MAKLYIISGITGMTGNELARQLLQRGDTVIGFDNFFASSPHTIRDILQHPNLSFFEYDINCTDQMQKIEQLIAEKKEHFEKVIYINCAAVVHTEHFYHVESTFDTNVLGMRSFMAQAIRQKAYAFINCSTSEVYSMQSWVEGGVRESDYLLMDHAEHSQRTSYAAGKLMTEFFMKDAVDRGLLKGCSIRFANVYSKNELYPKHIIPHIINELKQNGTVVLLENSKVNKRTFLHNIDSCAAVLALADSDAALDGTVYNVATDEEIAIVDLVKLCAKKMGIDNPQIVFEGYRASDPERRLLNTDKIRRRTLWKPQISLDKGIQMCIEEINKN
ncbi:NAD(P)-dependent oxidoreductase [Kineothrix sp. MSJ-39]|uniref:NAD-dependent epimerase/dehydratase family protein n=1 Tax=Kineothrix sp. MSJ-39 TaxID=2841533 RepID=UPI001C127D2E|nr:NAD(P)-dependent oxidoreductase [Kineothrix sp. MSJ-39]MBU5430982.1 NAD(P)-dependent oxidoreductase [Kineothrix sp. MSJ-39]